MRFQKLFIVLFSLFLCNVAHAQNIVKIVKQFVLINNVDELSGLSIGDRVPVFRTTGPGAVSKVGEVQIIKFANGKCAAKIVSESRDMKIAVRDYIDLTTKSNEIGFSENSASSISSGPKYTGIKEGDNEIQFAGLYMKTMSEYLDVGTTLMQFSYGKFITSRFQVGIAPQLTISKISSKFYGGETQTQFSASAFCNYNLTTASRLIPYVLVQWYQDDFSPEDADFFPEEADFIDYSYIFVGSGIRNFLNQYAALNATISYGFPLSSKVDGGILIITSGLSFIF